MKRCGLTLVARCEAELPISECIYELALQFYNREAPKKRHKDRIVLQTKSAAALP